MIVIARLLFSCLRATEESLLPRWPEIQNQGFVIKFLLLQKSCIFELAEKVTLFRQSKMQAHSPMQMQPRRAPQRLVLWPNEFEFWYDFPMKKRVFILVGPKGSGKSFLGKYLEGQAGIRFLRVEDIWIKLKGETISGQDFEREGCKRVVKAVAELLKTCNSISIESIGASKVFNAQVDAIKGFADVILIRIRVPLELCLKRVKERDPATHLNVSDERLEELNKMAADFEVEWDLEFENSTIGAEKAFADAFKKKFLVV